MNHVKFFTQLMIIAMMVIPFSPSVAAADENSFFLSTKAEIVWKASVHELPAEYWVYKKILPHVFPASTISNAVVLGSLESHGFPKPSTNDSCLDLDTCPCGHPCTFRISPTEANLSFSSPSFRNGSSEGIPSDEKLISEAWKYAALFAIDNSQLKQGNISSRFCEHDLKGKIVENNFCGREILLSRQLDGIGFYPKELLEGFSLELGHHGQIRSFTIAWPELRKENKLLKASPQRIVGYIKSGRAIIPPETEESDYFGRIRNLGKAKRITIHKITPYYNEGEFGKVSENNLLQLSVTPFFEWRL